MTRPAAYLREKGIPFREIQRGGGTQLVATCPFCNGGDDRAKDTFAVNADTGAWNCLRSNKCGRSGSFRALREALGDGGWDRCDVRPIVRRREAGKPASVKLADLSPGALRYLTEERRLAPSTLAAWNIHCKEGEADTIAFPYYREGVLLNAKYRHREGGKAPWKRFTQERDAEPSLYGHDLMDADSRDVVVVEGELDAMSLWQYGLRNVVSVPDGAGSLKWIDREWDWLSRFSVIYLALDDDEAGRKGAGEIARRLGVWRCLRVVLPEKDANECLKKGCDLEVLLEAMREAQDYRPEILVSADHFREEVGRELETYEGRDGVPSGIAGLNESLRGYRPGELTVWAGSNGSGKTTLTLQEVNRMATTGEAKVCVASLEMLPSAYLAWMVRQAMSGDGLNIHLRSILFDIWSEGLYVVDHYGSIEREQLLDAMKYAARRFGVTQFVVDSLVKIKMPFADRYAHEASIVQALKDFAMEERVHVHLVAHKRKGERDSEVPEKVDVRGASEITDLADNVLMLVRPSAGSQQPGGGASTLYLRKNRKYGIEGAMDLRFFEREKLFSQVGDPAPDWMATYRAKSAGDIGAGSYAPSSTGQVLLFTPAPSASGLCVPASGW